MSEETIIIEIDEITGEIYVKTKGIKGPACISEVEKIISDKAVKLDEIKTDEYYEETKVYHKRNISNLVEQKRGEE